MSTDLKNSRILFFLEGQTVPSSRFRVKQFEGILRDKGVFYRFLTTRPSKYLYYPNFLPNNQWLRLVILPPQLIIIIIQRIVQIVLLTRDCDVVFLQRDLLFRVNNPFLERFLFWWIGADKKVVLDVDDAIYLDKNGENKSSLKRKIEYIAKHSSKIIVGNNYLKEFFSHYSKCESIPTVIDTERFKRSTHAVQSKFVTLGWTGTKANLSFLRVALDAIEKLSLQYKLRLVVIAEKGTEPPLKSRSLEIEMRAWSENQEVEQLQDIDIGLMPLGDDPWTKGKCGLKLLIYMALGMPVVASPVGVNQLIVKDRSTGFLATTEEEWSQAVMTLINDRKLREEMGAKGREFVESNYSLKSWGEKWVKSLVCV